LAYTLTYANDGPLFAQDVTITDTLPDDVSFGGIVSADPPLPGFDQDGQSLTWYTPTLAAGASGSIIFTVTVNTDAIGVIANNVVINSSIPDADTSNNVAVEETVIGDPSLASIYGYVFEDSDGDGVRDDDEAGIQGVTVTLDGDSTTATDLDGLYIFFTPLAGVHAIVETDLPGYLSTTPNEVHVDVALGNSFRVDFGDALTATVDFAAIYGTVFEDSDADGAWDDDETGIQGVPVTLDDVTATTTGPYGSYTFSTTIPGIHSVVETDLPGYLSTTSNEVHVDAALGNDYEVNFGDALAASADFAAIYGTVFEDSNDNDVWDDDEMGIPDVTVILDDVTAVATDPYGGYTLSTTIPGDHAIVETDLPGYLSTTPNEVHVDVALGSDYQVDFGDILAGGALCPPDSYEEDDTADQAVGLSVRQTHDFCDDDTDWVTFAAQAGDVYTITTLAWGQRTDTFLALFDTDAQTLLVANDDFAGATDYSSRIVWKAPADGVYYTRVTNRAGLTGNGTDYDLWIEGREMSALYLPLALRNYNKPALTSTQEALDKHDVSLTPTGVINHVCQDDHEVDDTWGQAHAIESGVLQVHSFDSNPAFYAADKDFVWFDASAGGNITFTVVLVTNTQTLLEIYDVQGTALNVTGTSQLVWTPANSGHYYLSVSPLGFTFGCADTTGYHLLMEQAAGYELYLPLAVKKY
jgi:hypothetical protein